jgi:hypothetical protein
MPAFRRSAVQPLAFGVALACLLASGAAGAIAVSGKAAASSPAARPASAPASAVAAKLAPRTFATRDQLRDCMNSEDELHERLRKLDAAHDAHERAIGEVQAENDKIVEIQAQLDHDSQTAVNAYNLLVTQHNVRTDELNKEAREMTVQGQAFNADSLALNKRCAALAFRVDDMDAVMKERKAAGK